MGSESTKIRHSSREIFTSNSDIEDTDIFTLSEDDEDNESLDAQEKREQDRHESFEKLEGLGTSPAARPRRRSRTRSTLIRGSANRRIGRMRVPEAYIELKEEKVGKYYVLVQFLLIITFRPGLDSP
jgi:hypothetical protein